MARAMILLALLVVVGCGDEDGESEPDWRDDPRLEQCVLHSWDVGSTRDEWVANLCAGYDGTETECVEEYCVGYNEDASS